MTTGSTTRMRRMVCISREEFDRFIYMIFSFSLCESVEVCTCYNNNAPSWKACWRSELAAIVKTQSPSVCRFAVQARH